MGKSDFNVDPGGNDVFSLKRAIEEKLLYTIGKIPPSANPHDWLNATSLAVRDRLVQRWVKTTRAYYKRDVKRVYYLSMEFLIGRSLTNAALSLGIYDELKQALAALDVDIEEVAAAEPDAALGNGGLGRLAACFLDAMATLGISGMGYGIRYDYGMFRQEITDGNQVEHPDYWLASGHPWEFPRPEVQFRVRFGGRCERHGSQTRWVDTEDVLAIAYDTIIPGYATEATITLRLWSAKATDEMDLSAFNRGNYFGAVERRTTSETVSRVLYPDDSTVSGRELRLRQEYFFVSASVQDLLRRHIRRYGSVANLHESVAVHLNDTHPVLAIPELLRLLIDEQQQEWEPAWDMVRKVFSYTNHTLMHEALETWPVDMIGRMLPRHLDIIFEINARFLGSVASQFGVDHDLMRRLSLIDENGDRRVRMAYLAVVGSHKVNGVSKLHSQLMTNSIFSDLARVYPDRFNNKTNGISPRRWLGAANPQLAALIDEQIGPQWRLDLDRLQALRPLADDPSFVDACRRIKLHNKTQLAAWMHSALGMEVDPHSLFDVQVKRIHEYKRQLLNALHVVTRYNRILAAPEAAWVPRTIIFSGKAASAYRNAKLIIKLINDIAAKVNQDPRVNGLLRVVFVPNYGVSVAERIIPAADLSEQISLAGTEASGTGNMKLALNGALTIGTLDGANIEIREQVGQDNIFIFGHTAEEVQSIRMRGYRPRDIYESNSELQLALEQIRDGYFSPDDPERFKTIFDLLVNFGDQYLLLADYASYVATQERVDDLYRNQAQWHATAIRNIAGMGVFSADRTIADYAKEIWDTKPLVLEQ
ncbi:glycogen/starch/alpha-glucan phosphorylase [Noviherbaspirillum malthae]|jgi:starch phosphorylase|uniref:glycogen/starch/alpha-glucan phosphorylase n=1 Tax=Noviherbaspirillum malthae TaxID=1260987 RepID=UPI00188FFECF|nr:glycogen/starch/alpha-glucan phosphorylase [Noviherbaspirillum malthae]